MLACMFTGNLIYLAVNTALLVLGVIAFVDALRFPPAAYPAADRATKRLWLVFTGLGLAAQIFFPVLGVGLLGLLGVPTNPTLAIVGMAGVVAAIVYLVDVRPRLKQVTGRGSNW